VTELLNVGIIGAGRIGKVHAATIAQRVRGARLIGVADVELQRAQTLAQKYCPPIVTADYRELLDTGDLDAVLICSGTDTHARFIRDAAQAGKHIFCEKPIALDLREIDETLAVVERAGVKLQVGFNRRFDANFARVKRAIESDEIGQPALLHIISRDPEPPPISYVKVSGGMFLDMTIHDFDMARFLIGSEVEEVYAGACVTVDSAIGEAGDVDTAVVMLRFASGAIGTIDNCRRAAYGYDQRVEVLGSKGSIATTNNYPNAAIISDSACVRRDLPLNFFMDRYTESFISEVIAFVAAIIEGKPVPVTGRDARAPVVMGLAAGKSHREGRPVKLSEIAA
jgi:myo-inositol 2-dehydrogenase / D-chiro-inositol 1-dehydrogenase